MTEKEALRKKVINIKEDLLNVKKIMNARMIKVNEIHIEEMAKEVLITEIQTDFLRIVDLRKSLIVKDQIMKKDKITKLAKHRAAPKYIPQEKQDLSIHPLSQIDESNSRNDK